MCEMFFLSELLLKPFLISTSILKLGKGETKIFIFITLNILHIGVVLPLVYS